MDTANLPQPDAGVGASALAAALGIDRSPSRLVALDIDAVERVATFLAREHGPSAPVSWGDPEYWNTGDAVELRSQFLAVGNAINFRFWRLESGSAVPVTGLIDGVEERGALLMWRALRRAVRDASFPVLDARFMADLSEDAFREIFSDDGGGSPLDVALDERVANLRDLGRTLLEAWDGEFYNVVRKASGSLKRFAELSRQFRAYDDPVYKLTMLNAIMHRGSGLCSFDEAPVPAIDYHLLRHALRQGFIRPVGPLSQKLATAQLLSPEESYELRRVALMAFIELSDRTDISGDVLDNRYWLNRRNCADPPVCVDPATAAHCPFLAVCARRTAFLMPLELTRYY